MLIRNKFKSHIALPPDYKDGISQFRTSADGSPLPNARILSTRLFGRDDRYYDSKEDEKSSPENLTPKMLYLNFRTTVVCI